MYVHLDLGVRMNKRSKEKHLEDMRAWRKRRNAERLTYIKRHGKLCIRCDNRKPLNEFGTHKTSIDGHSSVCRRCRMEGKKRRNQRQHNRYYSKKCNTDIDYSAVLQEQNGRCAICGVDSNSIGRRLSIDHNHESGAFRGLLCHNCNVLLGHAKDSPDLLRKAICYLLQDENVNSK